MPIANTRPAPDHPPVCRRREFPNNSSAARPLSRRRRSHGSPDPELMIEQTFGANGWGGMWRNGIFPYTSLPFHDPRGDGHRPRPRQSALRRRERRDDRHRAPATSSSCRPAPAISASTQSRDLVVIGAYPPSGKYNLCRGSKAEHAKAVAAIPKVPPPVTDPVFGPQGPLIALWRA